jgi:hypothetical protein
MERSLQELSGETVNDNTLFFNPNFTGQAQAFLDMIVKYGWSNLALIYDQDPMNIELAS